MHNLLKKDEFLIEELNPEIFDLIDSIETAKDTIVEYNQLYDIYYLENIDYRRTTWQVYDRTNDIVSQIDFTTFYDHRNTRMLDILKCWVASLLLEYSGSYVIMLVRQLIEALNETKLFEIERIEEFEKYLQNTLPSMRITLIRTIKNFIDFYDGFDGVDDYLLLIEEYNDPQIINVRDIPSSRDCMMFIMVLNDYYAKESSSDLEQLYYQPLLIWWILTTKIPIRIGEFLKIKRNGITVEKISGEEIYFLRLPRIKDEENKRRVQVIDKIQISEEFYLLLNKHIKETERFGYSKTLISYPAYIGLRLELFDFSYSNNPKRDPTFMNLDAFHRILNNFYDYIVKREPYSLTVRNAGNDGTNQINSDRKQGIKNDIERRLRPNDTRHLAFIFLKLQGFHPVEIARLGGHMSLGTQQHYFNHKEFETDSSTIQLLRFFDINGKYFKANFNETVRESRVNTEIDNEFRKKFLLKIRKPDLEKWDKLEIGWCTINPKQCRTECFQCDYWKIDVVEFEEKYDDINKWINRVEDDAIKVYSSIEKLHKFILQDKEKSKGLMSQQKKELQQKSKRLLDFLRSIDSAYEKIYEQSGEDLQWKALTSKEN